jgi:hypothetical protein
MTNFFVQNWGDYADLSQGVIIYVAYSLDVLLVGWFGTQLTKHVRQNDLLLLLFSLLENYAPGMEEATV